MHTYTSPYSLMVMTSMYLYTSFTCSSFNTVERHICNPRVPDYGFSRLPGCTQSQPETVLVPQSGFQILCIGSGQDWGDILLFLVGTRYNQALFHPWTPTPVGSDMGAHDETARDNSSRRNIWSQVFRCVYHPNVGIYFIWRTWSYMECMG